MKKMPELVQLREKHPEDELVILGVNFDRDPEKARGAIAEHGLRWTQVHAEAAAAGHRDLWEEITGVGGLPRLFLVDRRGILREDFYPHDLEAKVAPYLGR